MLALLMVLSIKMEAQSIEEYGIPLISDVSQLSSNASDVNDGQHLEYLIDNNGDTYWHSDWHKQTNETYHWIQVALQEELTPNNEVSLMLQRRANTANDHPVEMTVWTSLDGEEFTQLTAVSIPYEGAGTISYSETFKVNESVKYLRFAATNCVSTYRKWWHSAEFQLFAINSKETASVRLNQVITKYDGYLFGDSKFDVGKEYGQYDAEELVNEFLTKLGKAYDILANYDPIDWPSSDEMNTLASDIERLYLEILNAQVVFHLPGNGYYRIFANLDYYVGQEDGSKLLTPKAMYSSLDGFGMWGDYDAKDCRFLWKLEETENGIDMVNVATDFRFDKMARPVTMSANAKTMMAFDYAGNENGRNIVYIRSISSKYDLGSSIFLHQWNHARGAGKGGQMCVWKGTFNMGEQYTSDKGASEWYLEPISEEEVAALIKSFEPIKNHDVLVEQYQELLNKANDALSMARDVGTCTPNLDDPQILEVTQFTSNWTETAEGDITSLLDGDSNTYWHSKWKSGSVPNHTHSIDVSFPDPLPAGVYQGWIQRRGNSDKDDNVILMSVYGSNDESTLSSTTEEGWTFIASNLNAPWDRETKEVFLDPFEMSDSYKYLRFYNDGTAGPTASKCNRGFFHMGGFQLYPATKTGYSQIEKMGETGKNLIDAVAVASKLISTPDAITYDTDYKALESAYEAFMEILVDPQELRDAIASAEGIADMVSVGNAPGQWPSKSEADALTTLLAEATAYNQSGALDKETSSNYVEKIVAAKEAFFNAALKVETGMWYQFRFPTEEIFQKYELKSDAAVGSVFGDSFGRYISAAKLDGEITQPYLDDVREGCQLFLMDQPADEDFSMFRFVEVGDAKYVIQNKATGLFVSCQGANSNFTLSLTPCVFNISAIGYGENLLQATTLNGVNLANLSLQNSEQRIATSSDSTPGSNAAWLIESTEEKVAADYEPMVNMDIVPGKLYPMCYPVALSNTEGVFYSVSGTYTENGKDYVALNKIENPVAGEPCVYLYETLEDFVPVEEGESQETCVISFKISSTSFIPSPVAKNGFVGNYEGSWVDSGIVVFSDNKVVVADGKDKTECTRSIAPNAGYILFGQKKVEANANYDLCLEVNGQASEIENTYLMFRSDLACSGTMSTEVLAPFTYELIFTGLDPFIGVGVLSENLTDEQTIIAFEYQCSENLEEGEFFFNPIKAGREQHYQGLEAATEWTPAYVDISESRINFNWGKAGDWLRWDPVPTGRQTVKARNFEIITPEEMDFRITGVHDIIPSLPGKGTGSGIYDLTGRRASKMQKGLYIINGKKYRVK